MWHRTQDGWICPKSQPWKLSRKILASKRCAGDMFSDLEGDAFIGLSGREYLFGVVLVDDSRPPVYESRRGSLDSIYEPQTVVSASAATWQCKTLITSANPERSSAPMPSS